MNTNDSSIESCPSLKTRRGESLRPAAAQLRNILAFLVENTTISCMKFIITVFVCNLQVHSFAQIKMFEAELFAFCSEKTKHTQKLSNSRAEWKNKHLWVFLTAKLLFIFMFISGMVSWIWDEYGCERCDCAAYGKLSKMTVCGQSAHNVTKRSIPAVAAVNSSESTWDSGRAINFLKRIIITYFTQAMLSPAGMHGMAFNSIQFLSRMWLNAIAKENATAIEEKTKYKSIWINLSFVQIVNDIFVIENH